MDTISIRYGEDVALPIDTGDTTAVSADIYIGLPGQVYVFTSNITLTAGVGTFVFSGADMQLPLGTYNYQINTTDVDGHVEKYPSPCESCDSDFPQFIVCDVLDVVEVS